MLCYYIDVIKKIKKVVYIKVGYVRISHFSQNTARQDILMKELGVEKVFIDKMSGKNMNRPQLQEMLNFVRENDTVIVSEISRFARCTKDLLELTDILNKKKVQFISIKENIDTQTPVGKFMLTIFGAISQLEREYIKEKQREGIEIAKKQGKYKGKQKIKIDEKKFRKIYEDWKNGSITAINAMKLLELKPNTFYRRVKEFEEKHLK